VVVWVVTTLIRLSGFRCFEGIFCPHFQSSNWRKYGTSIVTCRPVAGRRFSEDKEYAGDNRIISVAMQRAVNRTIDEEVIYMWFAYIHRWATDMFSMVPP
jgi:hypothetical protein